ncbi:elongation of very long chain fatty acids protein 1 isoform X4 [Neodiprion lecontei]|uniref:Elongation of very long chain fatty acids protein n=1 Tax=Neodiprion lecontei TaxID=441921 RepID=A0ABM3GK62_NEOLC|nr:elongation of very long chain fatty acids protein 1 isoform X4 [Neodiprion lecontei]
MKTDLEKLGLEPEMEIVETYRFLMEEISDPRVRNWFLMSSPLPVALTLLAYLGFVLYFGPRFMERRSPYSLHRFMVAYNIFVAISSGVIFYGLLTSGFTTNISLGCEPVDFSYSPEPLNMARWVWWLLLLKIVELGDTVVFILRKKYNQASFLHIYHHVATVMLSWIACKYAPDSICDNGCAHGAIADAIMRAGPETTCLHLHVQRCSDILHVLGLLQKIILQKEVAVKM